MVCDGSGRIASRPDLASQLTDGLADNGLNLREGIFFEVVETCPGCSKCFTECEYWRTGRYKCGDCNTCCSEANEILLRRKEGD